MFHNTPQVAGAPVTQVSPVQPVQGQYPQAPQGYPQQMQAPAPQGYGQPVNTMQSPYQDQHPQYYTQYQQMPNNQMLAGQHGQPYQPAQTPNMQTAPVAPVTAREDATSQVQAFLDTAGISRSQVEQELSSNGKVSDRTMRALVATHGEGTTNLLVNSISTMYQSSKNQATSAAAARHDYVAEAFKDVTQQTGAETFRELTTWWQQPDPATGQPRMDDNMKREINTMLKAGGLSMKMALDHLINGFREQNGQQQNQNIVVDGSNTAALGTGGGEITAADYAKQYDAIVRKEGMNSPKLRVLDAQRMRSMQRGI